MQTTVTLAILYYLHRNTIPLLFVERLPFPDSPISHRDNIVGTDFPNSGQLNLLSSEKQN